MSFTSWVRNKKNVLLSVPVLVFSNATLPAQVAKKPVTVCEVLENPSVYAGKSVLIIGRLSSNLIDGEWLSQNGCGNKTQPGDPNWPYAIFLGCDERSKRPAPVGKLSLDPAVLEVKLNQLRKSAPLDFTDIIVQLPSGKEFKKVRQKESWAAVYGRVKLAQGGNRGGFGAVRAKAELCKAEGGTVYFEDSDSGGRR